MPSGLVAGRVKAPVKERADYYIKKAGLTTSDVIRITWENIANTGLVPMPVCTDAAPGPRDELLQELEELWDDMPPTPFLRDLTPEGLREELANRD